MTKQYFTKQEAMEDIKYYLENGGDCYGADLHHEVFNTDYYIIGTYKAKQALEQYGVFNAIDEVQTYEKENFGEIYTDLSNPENVANMLYYIKGIEAEEGILDLLEEEWSEPISEENAKNMIERINSIISE